MGLARTVPRLPELPLHRGHPHHLSAERLLIFLSEMLSLLILSCDAITTTIRLRLGNVRSTCYSVYRFYTAAAHEAEQVVFAIFLMLIIDVRSTLPPRSQ
jgi:hypothetical protein